MGGGGPARITFASSSPVVGVVKVVGFVAELVGLLAIGATATVGAEDGIEDEKAFP